MNVYVEFLDTYIEVADKVVNAPDGQIPETVNFNKLGHLLNAEQKRAVINLARPKIPVDEIEFLKELNHRQQYIKPTFSGFWTYKNFEDDLGGTIVHVEYGLWKTWSPRIKRMFIQKLTEGCRTRGWRTKIIRFHPGEYVTGLDQDIVSTGILVY